LFVQKIKLLKKGKNMKTMLLTGLLVIVGNTAFANGFNCYGKANIQLPRFMDKQVVINTLMEPKVGDLATVITNWGYKYPDTTSKRRSNYKFAITENSINGAIQLVRILDGNSAVGNGCHTGNGYELKIDTSTMNGELSMYSNCRLAEKIDMKCAK
jgi:hypothetical protein